MQEEKEEVRTLLLPFLGQSLNCAECFAVVKVYARYRGLLWPCFDHWALDGLAIPLSAVSGNVVCGCCEMIFYSFSLSRERDMYTFGTFSRSMVNFR